MTKQEHAAAIFEASRALNDAIKAACADGVLVSVDFDFYRTFSNDAGAGAPVRHETQIVKAGVYLAP